MRATLARGIPRSQPAQDHDLGVGPVRRTIGHRRAPTTRIAPTHSKAALAQALCRQGVVAEAMRGGGDGLPLLRGVTAQTLAGIANEEQVLVFAERVRCLRQLTATLRERHGIEAHVADGSINGREFDALKQRFTATGTARGPRRPARRRPRLDPDLHPLHPRRRNRPHRLHPLPRGGEHHQVLDSCEGVAAADSTVATQLGQITGEIAEHKARQRSRPGPADHRPNDGRRLVRC
ncbi:MAG TPA: hypothetical protein VFZ00_15110 [Solirubrobacter sp.]|nr:hypothetical protein [Solirubrobacter sp.]